MILNILNIQSPINYNLILWVSIIVILLFLLFIITTLFISQKRLFQNKRNISQLHQTFDKELLKTKVEIQEQTFANIATELHDNIGQVLSFLKLSLSANKSISYEELYEKLDDSKILVDQVIKDLRSLEKTLSYQNIKKSGLLPTILQEVDRINKSKIISIKLTQQGSFYIKSPEIELVIFRIFQESLNNILKHANAENVYVYINFLHENFTLTITDDGIGFNRDKINEGSGLYNLNNRATLIGAKLHIESQQGKGTKIDLKLYHE